MSYTIAEILTMLFFLFYGLSALGVFTLPALLMGILALLIALFILLKK